MAYRTRVPIAPLRKAKRRNSIYWNDLLLFDVCNRATTRNTVALAPFMLMKGGLSESGLKASEAVERERLQIEAAQKEPRRFAELYDGHFARVYAYVARRVANRAEAEDVTAEVFHHALANLERFEWRGAPFAAWLFRIAANAIADRWRKSAREQGSPGQMDPPSVEEIADVEQRATLFQLVENLPAEQRRVIVMRFVEGKKTEEIGKEMRKTAGAVRQLQFRALENLRARMNEKSEVRNA
jgi:RNA polymerase sigma-70 factor, ECF subfamily